MASIAFPAISTGAFGYPVRDAGEVAFSAIRSVAAELTTVQRIRFVLWSEDDFNIHRQLLNNLAG